MKGQYEPDNFTEIDVLRCLESRDLHYKQGHRYILSQCPTHEDKNPSVQIYKDDWFVNCHAGCGRYHITKAFPELRTQSSTMGYRAPAPVRSKHSEEYTDQLRQPPVEQVRGSSRVSLSRGTNVVSEHEYIAVDLMKFWLSLQEIPRTNSLHTVPADLLNNLGWRYDPNNKRYFIPYFSASRDMIPFAQWRNLGEGPRFNFWKGAKPTMYGTWNLDNPKLFLVEGTSDCAVLEYASVPFIGAPSAASGALVGMLADYCVKNGIQLVYAGDNDLAGNKLREVLDAKMPYRVKQSPKPYKDWGEFLENTDLETVQNYCFEELFGKSIQPTIDIPAMVVETFGESEVLLETSPFESKELPLGLA